MKNVTFIINNYAGELEVLCALASLGYKWEKRGRKISAYGVDDEMFDLITSYADNYWCW